MSFAKDPLGKGRSKRAKQVKTDLRPETVFDDCAKIIRQTYQSTEQIRSHFEIEPGLRTNLAAYVATGNRCNDWIAGDFSPERAIACATDGLMDNVELIKTERRRAEKLDVQVQFPSWQADVAGAFADVPAFVAGDPLSMRRLVNQVSDTRPVRIFVGMASSCTFTHEQLAKRGALIAALALQLSKTRTVDVYAINSGRKHFSEGPRANQSYDWSLLVKLPKPLSASDMSYWLCHQASVRGLLYAAERWFSGPLAWPRLLANVDYNSPEGIAAHAKLWDAGESDVVVPFPMAQTRAEADMLANPETWLKNTLQRLNAI